MFFSKKVWFGFAVLLAGLIAVVGLTLTPQRSAADLPEVTVYKAAACGCCAAWADHMEEAGFAVKVVDRKDMMRVKAAHYVPQSLHSCHTATVEGYTVEGHVPAADVKHMLESSSNMAGIGAGGMPKGSPGMPGMPESFTVQSFTKDGQMSPYSHH